MSSAAGLRHIRSATVATALATCALAQEGPPPALVVTQPVSAEAITERVDLIGTVRPIHDSLVASEVEGRVAGREVDNGDRVREGTILVRLDTSRFRKDLDRAIAERDDVRAQRELALIQERRALDLHEEEILSRGELDEAVARRQSLDGRAAALEVRIASIRDDIARTEIRAPFEGVVTEVHCEIGEWIGRGDPVVRLSDLGTVEIVLEVPEHYYRQLRRGAPARAVVDALPGLVLDGRIFAVVPRADPEARTFPVIVRAANPEGQVGAGMLARTTLVLSEGEQALIVPKDAIVRQALQEIVWIVEDGVVRAVSVRTGRGSGDRVEIFGDVRAGDTVVVRGNERLQPGQRVTIQTADAGSSAGTQE